MWAKHFDLPNAHTGVLALSLFLQGAARLRDMVVARDRKGQFKIPSSFLETVKAAERGSIDALHD